MMRPLILSVSALSLSACASLNIPKPSSWPGAKLDAVQPAVRSAASVSDIPGFWAEIEGQSEAPNIGTGRLFNDPLLQSYIDQALAANRSVLLAEKPIRSARAQVAQAAAGQRPSVGYNVTANRQGQVDGFNSIANIQPGLSASWELDLWGRIRAGKYAAEEGVAVAESDYRAAQQSIAASVAQVYFQLIEAKLRTQIARDQVAALTEITRIVRVQYENGVISGQDIALAEADLANARQSVVTAQYGVDQLTRALEVLIDEYPDNALETAAGFPPVPAVMQAGIPANLLERRPDLVAAERRIAAAFYALEQAKVAGLPTVSLTSTLGGASRSVFKAFDPGNFGFTAGSSFVGPLYDAGLIKAGIEIADVNKQQAIDNYRLTALTAFQDVENALGAIKAYRAAEQDLIVADQQSRDALKIADIRYQAGEISLVDVLSIQQRTFTTASNLATIRQQLLNAYVSLNLALGGEPQ